MPRFFAGSAGGISTEQAVDAVENALTVAPTGEWNFTQAPTVGGAPIDGGDGVTIYLPGDTTPDPIPARSVRLVVIGQAPPAPADTTAPAEPTNLTAVAGDAQITYGWTAATDNIGVTGYRIRRGGSLIAAPAGTSYTLTGLTNGTEVSDVTVSAIDAAGNESTSAIFPPVTPVAPPADTWFADFASMTAGTFPVGFTAIWDTAANLFSITDEATAANGKALQLVITDGPSQASNRAIRWDTPGAVIDAEIVFKWKTAEALSTALGLLRGGGTAAADATGYGAGVRPSVNGNRHQVVRQAGTTSPTVIAESAVITTPVDTWMITRSRISGTTVQSRTWPHGQAEPTTWDVTATDATHGSGVPGLFLRQLDPVYPVLIDWIGLGKGTTAAPVGS